MNDLNDISIAEYAIKNYSDYCSSSVFQIYNLYKIHHVVPRFTHCLFDLKNKIIFILINKCASSSMEIILKSNNFCEWNPTLFPRLNPKKDYFIKNDYKFYAIIREPKSRYISGLQEFIRMGNPPLEFIISNLKNNKFIFDDHTIPQHCFLSLCDNQCNYFRMDENLSSKVSKLIGNDIIIPKKNISLKSIEIKCKNLFEKYCEENSEFYKLYGKDFKLYDISV